MKEKYIIVKVRFKDKNKANVIFNTLLNRMLVAGGTISKVISKYYEKGRVLMHEDYELNLETKSVNFEKICRIIENTYGDENYKAFAIDIEKINSNFSRYIDIVR